MTIITTKLLYLTLFCALEAVSIAYGLLSLSMSSGTSRRSVVAKFVIPLAGLLTVLSARLFDLGDGTMDPDEETAPLLNERVSSIFEDEGCVVHERPMKHVVAVLMIGFFTAVFVILCLVFGGMDYILSTKADNATQALYGALPKSEYGRH
jgi:hypothetical protein